MTAPTYRHSVLCQHNSTSRWATFVDIDLYPPKNPCPSSEKTTNSVAGTLQLIGTAGSVGSLYGIVLQLLNDSDPSAGALTALGLSILTGVAGVCLEKASPTQKIPQNVLARFTAHYGILYKLHNGKTPESLSSEDQGLYTYAIEAEILRKSSLDQLYSHSSNKPPHQSH